MGLRDAARWLKEKIIGKKSAQESQEADRMEEPDIPSGKSEKEQEEAENEATEDVTEPEICKNATEKIPDEAFECIAEKCAALGMSAEEMEEAWKRALMAIAELCSSLDKWQKAKLMMPNNERRRRGIPMVRRQQYLRNLKKQNRKRRGKPDRAKYKPGVYAREERTRSWQ